MIRGARSSCLRLLGAAAAVVAIDACVLADPAPTLPLVAQGPIVILNSVTPPQGILTEWPTRFVVPLYVEDPSKSVQWLAFEDYTTDVTDPLFSPPVTVNPQDGGVQFISASSIPRPGGPGCHTLEVVIAYSFSVFAPTDPSTAAIAKWFYESPDSPGGCAAYDAGDLTDATFPDAALPDATLADGAP